MTLPLGLARGVLRPALSESELCRVQETLRLTPPPSEERWLKRTKDTQLKLTSGGPIELAEVVRDVALRQQRLITKPGAFLSTSERTLYTRARRLLAGEIGLANDLDPEEADAWITEQLNPTRPLANADRRSGDQHSPSIAAGAETSTDAR